MWYLSGSDDVESIRYYISKYRDSAESDGTINGAYGPRLFGTKNGINQIENVIRLLKNATHPGEQPYNCLTQMI
jgi:thymidylate synthase